MEPRDDESPDYEPLTAECYNCGMPIVQWRRSPNASYKHVHSGHFACDKKFQTTPIQAQPRKVGAR